MVTDGLLCTGTAVGAKRSEPSRDEKIIVSLYNIHVHVHSFVLKEV